MAYQSEATADQNTSTELRSFDLTQQEGKRLLEFFNYPSYGNPAAINSRLQKVCHDHDIERSELYYRFHILREIRGTEENHK